MAFFLAELAVLARKGVFAEPVGDRQSGRHSLVGGLPVAAAIGGGSRCYIVVVLPAIFSEGSQRHGARISSRLSISEREICGKLLL
jgi:hypothetical protein